ncbi:MAG TPA: sigma 54-interacting transcriptional regulator [Noviherbaspirillum sp.]|jgi:transcriptional regulator with PAS, ATPase and Fis domain|uniref:sigma-54 interaction domain-containing protein n=1 Tax=Noviherbaspirillum sp. TaxID=1926288 RepID=UPI002DDC96EC|nr:sigma 54-interacting transcriptional regulator [Noviherbaspirillum sp.]HEV2608771.1 sigma 54-interacting transcriptional regulator [Noviherbaspirillum sp.]
MKSSVSPSWDVDSILRVGMQSLLDLFDDSCEGTLAVDDQGQVAWINDKYAAFLGLKAPEDALGKPVEEVIPNSRMREIIQTGKPILLDIMMIREQPLVVMRIPLKDDAGKVIGALGFALYDRLQRLKPLVSKFAELQWALANTQKELAQLRHTKYSISSFVGVSPVSLELKHRARRAAQLDTTVLLLGETGSGKELLAHGIHAASGRAGKPFVGINIAAVPETLLEAEFFGVSPGAYTGADRKGRDGKFKVADGGTLFLDEVGDMPLQVQAKLLRVLQEQEIEPLGSNKIIKVDVRVIAATSHDLKQLVADGKFRSDLYYRLNVLPIALPPLRERRADLDALCEHLLEQIAKRTGMPQRELAPCARAALAAYSWPGNVRELRNALEQAGMLTDNLSLKAENFAAFLPIVTEGATPPESADTTKQACTVRPLAEAVAEVERKLIKSALESTGGNKASAAKMLGISRATLYQKITEFNLLSN